MSFFEIQLLSAGIVSYTNYFIDLSDIYKQ